MPDVTPNALIPYPIPADNLGVYPDTSGVDLADRLDALWVDHEARLPVVIIKPTSETVVTSTALQDDDDLHFAVEANAVYVLDTVIIWEASAASGIHTMWTGPAGVEFSGVARINVDVNAFTQEPAPEMANAGFGIGSLLGLAESYLIQTDATPGTVKFRWAQSVSHATNTRVKLGSYLKISRIS